MAKWLEKEVVSPIDGIPPIEEWQSARCSACGKYHTTPYMYYFDEYKFCPNCGQAMDGNSEKPNNCEHITEDGVTCAKYPACDDCPDNPSNKVKGSERLVKGKDEPQTDCPWK